jgi:hypothetical protein
MSCWRWSIAVVTTAKMACTPVKPNAAAVTSNDCLQHACSAYGPGDASTCVRGACLSSTSVPRLPNLVLVVAIPNDAFSAPGRTYAESVTDLDASAPPGIAPTAKLPQAAPVLGSYQVDPSSSQLLHWNLGNQGQTYLPSKVTYRSLWGAPTGLVDALDAGLPTYPVFAEQVEQQVGVPGPAGGPGFQFRVDLPPGTYERTVAPEPPFDQAFPPDVSVVVVAQAAIPQLGPILDTTTYVVPQREIPRFDIDLSRVPGLDGSTAYLRDATTRRPISPIQILRAPSTPDGGVEFATSHHPPGDAGDALWNAQLAVVPPPASNLPTFVVSPTGMSISRRQVYPVLPPLVTVQGSITGADGGPVTADVLFEALMIYAAPGVPQAQPSDAGEGGIADGGSPPVFRPNFENFELVARTRAEPDSSGASSYSISLPPGTYRRVILPLDTPVDGGGFKSAMLSGRLPIDLQASLVTDTVQLGTPYPVDGTATVADRRPLAGATVEAIPMHCPTFNDVDGAPTPGDSASCMPRTAQESTDADGKFHLKLDPGGYLLRVEPADGTRLPWRWQPIVVPSSLPIEFRIPAPVYGGMVLTDAAKNPIRGAVVRMFLMQSAGPAIEVGRAITDATGRFDMYLDPSIGAAASTRDM